ncbi:DMT family transporter [Kiloniella sp. b19]|uniref:DMT family transporter n=1 Tax=Kiloniella sp. GXU_MW_B19 TaxID=3141326 RepID=UPI0031D88C65
MQTRDWLFLSILACLWGFSFLFVELGLQMFTPQALVTLRVGIGALFLWLVLAPGENPFPHSWSLWGWFLLVGLINNAIPFNLISLAQEEISSGMASILNATTPFWALLIARIVHRDEPVTFNRLAGLMTGIAGVAVLVAPDDTAVSLPLGATLMMFGATLSYAIAGQFGRKLLSVTPLQAACGSLTGATLFSIPATLYSGFYVPEVLPGEGNVWLMTIAVLGIAIPCTALAYPLYFIILKSSGATNLLLVTLLVPVVAVLVGVVLLNETITSQALAGMGIILFGLVVLDGRIIRKARNLFSAHPS